MPVSVCGDERWTVRTVVNAGLSVSLTGGFYFFLSFSLWTIFLVHAVQLLCKHLLCVCLFRCALNCPVIDYEGTERHDLPVLGAVFGHRSVPFGWFRYLSTVFQAFGGSLFMLFSQTPASK